jgi:hypothetical protein
MTATDQSGARFDFGRVTNRIFALIGRNFVPFAVLSLIFSGAPYFIIMMLQPALFGGGDPTTAMTATIIISLISFLGGLVLQGALTRASIDDLSGKGVSIGNALNAGLAVLLPLLGLGIVVGLGVIAGLILLIVPGVILAIRWCVAAPVVVVEKLGIMASMGRSAKLTEGNRWAIFGLLVVYAIIVWILSVVVVLAIPGSFAAVAGAPGASAPILFVIVMTIIQALQALLATVGVAAIYFELRQIKDGVDVTQLASVFE